MTTHPLPRQPFAGPRIAAISDSGQRRPIAVVIGMHRSGTSLCAHILSAMGIDMADEISAAPSNAKGHWERWEIVEFHDRILHLFNRDYFGPFHDFPLPAAWWADPRVSQIKREIVAFLSQKMSDGYFGFKDPRTVHLMPLWHQIFNDLKLSPKVVLCVRNPAQVARSLQQRDRLDPAVGEYRWLIYMVDFFRYRSWFEVCTINYEDWFKDPHGNFEKLTKFLDVEWRQSRADLDLVLSGIIDPTLRHDESHYNEAHQPLVRSFYRLVGDCGRDGGMCDDLDNFVAQFIGFQNLQAPLHQTLEGLAVKYPVLEREAVALRANIEQRATVEAALHVELEQGAEILRETLAGIERNEREHNAARQVLQAETTALEARLSAAEQDLHQRTAEAEALRGEITSSRTQLTAAQRAAGERATTAAAMQREITALHSELAAARDVGAALASLLAPPSPIIDVPRNTGWVAGVLRRLTGYPMAIGH